MKNGIGHMNRIKPGDHLVLLYHDREAEKPVAAFIAASLQRNEKCLYIKGDTDTDLMLRHLSTMVDFRKMIEDGHLYILDKSEAYAKDNDFDPDKMIEMLRLESENAVKEGFSGLSVTGEISWVLDYADGRERIIEYEWKLNERLFDRFPVTALCRYNLDRFSPKMIKSIIELHPFILYENQLNENPFYVPPEGYRDNKIEEYAVKAWLKNINRFTNTKSCFKSDIKKKEEEYEDLFNRIQDAISVSELDEEREDILIRRVNPASERLSGYPLDTLPGRSIRELDPTPGLYEWVLSCENGFEATFESEVIQSNGKRKPVEVTAKVFEDKGKRYILTVTRDISLRKRYVEDILVTIANFLEIHDVYTKGHSESVASLARETAKALKLPKHQIDAAYWTGLVHDIGKMLIPSTLLNKPGKLSPEEYRIIQQHPVWAYEAIIKNEALEDIARYARHHHERWDGGGYPDGLKESEIPLISQILAVADAYDAMTSERAYRKALTRPEAEQELRTCRGTQFAPAVVDVFIEKLLRKKDLS